MRGVHKTTVIKHIQNRRNDNNILYKNDFNTSINEK
jgi:hypothetical protein